MKRVSREKAKASPEMGELLEDWSWCVDQRDKLVAENLRHNIDSRSCWWKGQSRDGRRWTKRDGEPEIFPWPGASDQRIHLVDHYVRTDAAMLMTVWRRNKIRVSGTEITDASWASRMTQIIRWMRYTQMKEYPTETRLLTNYIGERGAAVLGCWWVQQRQLGYQTVTRAMVDQYAAAAVAALQLKAAPLIPGLENAQLAELPWLIDDPSKEDEALMIADVLWPETSKQALRKALNDLREDQECKIPRPYRILNRPKVCALALNEDIFLAPECTDIDENTSQFHIREQVTETTLRDRIRSMGWSRKWVEAMVDTQQGVMTSSLKEFTARRAYTMGSGSRVRVSSERLFEVIHTYRRQFDENDVPVLKLTCWNPGLATSSSRRTNPEYAYDGDLGYDHGRLPAILFRREMRSKVVDDSRGIGQVASTWEDAIKAEFDSSRDRNSLNTVPPSYYPPGQPPQAWGPGAQVGTAVPEMYGFFKGPTWDVGSREMRQGVLDLADRYMGRPLPDGRNQLESTYLTQDQADSFMETCAHVDTMILQLCQQFMPDEFVYRIVGAEQGRAMKATRDEIQGEFDLSITYNVQDLDNAVVKEKIGLMQEAISMDRDARIDTGEALQVAFDLLDPQLGERLIQPASVAQEKELADEADAFAKMFAGIQVDVKPGQAYELRLRWLDQMLKQNATAQARLQADPNFAELVDNRRKQLAHQVEQFTENARIGRNGA